MSLSPLSLEENASEVPPVIGWDDWYPNEAAITWEAMHPDGPAAAQHGMHKLLVGPTQSGKTTLGMFEAMLRDYVVVFGTKPRDPSLDRFIANGFLRIDHWPPTRQDIRKGQAIWPEGRMWFILWPEIKEYADLWRHRPLFAEAISRIFVKGNWTFVADEGLWLGGREGLSLGRELSGLAYGAASNGVSMYLLMQRPAGLPRIIWSSVMQALIFHSGVTEDIRELTSLGIYEPKDVARAIRKLRGRQFLDLPIRGQANWSVSEVSIKKP